MSTNTGMSRKRAKKGESRLIYSVHLFITRRKLTILIFFQEGLWLHTLWYRLQAKHQFLKAGLNYRRFGRMFAHN